MKRFLLALVWLLLASSVYAQPQPVLTPPSYASLPATCRVGSLVTKTTATAGLYVCSATNTWTIVSSGTATGAPADATYITQTANSTLKAEQPLAALATGLMNSTITTGAVTTLAPTDDNTVVGSGTAWALKALPSCSAGTSALSYNTTTNAFGCNTISGTFSGSLADTQIAFGTAANTIGGNANVLVVTTALTTPVKPVVTPTCSGTCLTNYSYGLKALNLIGETLSSNENDNFTTVQNAATLDGSHFNTIATLTQAGATSIAVFRTTDMESDTYYIGSVAPGASLVDNGLVNGIASGAESGNSTTGTLLYLGRTRISLGADDNSQSEVYIGSAPELFTTELADVVYHDFMHIAWHGTTNNKFALLSSVMETTDFGAPSYNANSWTTGTGTPIGISVNAGNAGTHNLTAAYGVRARINDVEGATGTNPIGASFYAYNPSNGGAGAYTTVAGYYVADAGMGFGTNRYGFYSTLDSGSGKYAAYFGGTAPTHFGGDVDLTSGKSITARYIANGSTPAVTDTSADSCGSGTQTIAGNDNAGKVTVIGSGGTSCTVTFATAFANAPSCSATNETTAALARATSTTSTVILAGVFLQNDVIAYTCLGR